MRRTWRSIVKIRAVAKNNLKRTIRGLEIIMEAKPH